MYSTLIRPAARCMPLLLTAACLAGCQQRFSFKPAVHVGSTKAPVIGLVFVPQEYLALQARLEELFDTHVLFDPGLSADAILQQLAEGRWQFAILSAGEYLGATPRQGVQPLAVSICPNDRPTMHGLLVARKDSGVNQISDCKGKRFAFGPAGDLLYDYAARAALNNAGVADSDLARELLPQFVVSGRLHLGGRGAEVARVVAFDPTVPAGVIDEIAFARLPESGGNVIMGPSRDMFTIIGSTLDVPDQIVLAGAGVDPVMSEKLRNYFIKRIKDEPKVCEQMGVRGFVEPSAGVLETARQLVPRKTG
ncbi:MAG: PhnD/SsuA/transferrin family substrate-binding protein [Phycisphaerae bacterium]|nr:phosphate/phosphite/phosphonate ABC transporter substrate-binding protein [Phycisphaerae bacterium]NUQ44547.1 PhnD/SsuA/transferrin family substrate-binding protein [Phycisphaerae bacterium]